MGINKFQQVTTCLYALYNVLRLFFFIRNRCLKLASTLCLYGISWSMGFITKCSCVYVCMYVVWVVGEQTRLLFILGPGRTCGNTWWLTPRVAGNPHAGVVCYSRRILATLKKMSDCYTKTPPCQIVPGRSLRCASARRPFYQMPASTSSWWRTSWNILNNVSTSAIINAYDMIGPSLVQEPVYLWSNNFLLQTFQWVHTLYIYLLYDCK